MSDNSKASPPADAPPRDVASVRAYFFRNIPFEQQRLDHGYSKVVADRFGIPAALVLKYLEFRISKSATVIDGRQWHCQSIADIKQHYPYLSASTIHAALRSIPEDLLARRQVKSRKTRSLTTAYALPDQTFQAQVKSDLLYLNPQHGAQFGLHEAVIIHHLQHWIRMKRKKNSEYRFHPLAPTELAGQLRISRASISRAITALVAGGVLEKKQGCSKRCPEYALTAAYEPIGDPIKTGNDALKPGCSSVNPG